MILLKKGTCNFGRHDFQITKSHSIVFIIGQISPSNTMLHFGFHTLKMMQEKKNKFQNRTKKNSLGSKN